MIDLTERYLDAHFLLIFNHPSLVKQKLEIEFREVHFNICDDMSIMLLSGDVS